MQIESRWLNPLQPPVAKLESAARSSRVASPKQDQPLQDTVDLSGEALLVIRDSRGVTATSEVPSRR